MSTGTPLPTEAYALGTPTAEYKGSGLRWVGALVMIVIGGMMLAFAGAAVWEEVGVGPLCFAGLSLGVVVYGFFQLVQTIVQRDLRVLVFNDGFMHTAGGKNTVIRWDEIRAVWQAITVHKRYGATVNTTYQYTVEDERNQKLVLNNTLSNIKQLGELIQDQATKRLLPKIADNFKAGMPVSFGKLTVSKQGLSNGRETLPWDQIEQVSLNSGLISVKKQGKWLSWGSQTVAQTPNVFVLLTLVDRIVGVNKPKN